MHVRDADHISHISVCLGGGKRKKKVITLLLWMHLKVDIIVIRDQAMTRCRRAKEHFSLHSGDVEEYF